MKKKQLLVSVIIPVYNAEKYLSKCIESIINQTYKNIEIILINDGSTDNSSNICDAYISKDNRIKVIHKQNEGVSTARNLGIEEAKGEYISFVDSDDWLVPDAYERIMHCISKYNVDVVMFEYFVDNYNGNEIHKTYPKLNGLMNREKAIKTTISSVNRFVWSKVFSRKIFGGLKFDTTIHFGEDTLFSAYVIDKANKIYYMSRPLYHYFQSENSATRLAFNPKMFTGVEAYRQLVEICNLKYPSIIEIAQSAYKNLILNTSIILLDNSNYPNFKMLKGELLKKFRKGLPTLLLSRKVSNRMKFKFAVGYLSPRLLYFFRKLKSNINFF